MITFKTPKHHWNYYLAIEKDLEHLSRYIEFAPANLGTYSIELVHILLSASSEVDVVTKQLCNLLSPGMQHNTINDYRATIQSKLGSLISEPVTVNRFGLTFRPWENWVGESNPDWWRSYNKVKHERNSYFQEANLQNTVNAVGALLLTTIYFYKYAFSFEAKAPVNFRETTRQLDPHNSFLQINSDYYYHALST
jgi:hypothetical protein